MTSSDQGPDRRITVASVPATHVYVRRLAHPRVDRLRDPSGHDHRTPCFLDPAWWDAARDVPDVLHVHFGFEYYDPAQLRDLVAVLDRRGVPLVYTVHDLRNPNHATPALQDAGLDVLVASAMELLTLTDWAATRILDRWGRRATVLPHPHVAELDDLRPPSRPSSDGTYRLGLHFKSLRPNMVGAPLLAAAADVARAEEALELEVHLHADVVSPRGANHDPALVASACDLADEGLVDVRVHPYLAHDALVELVRRCDGYVLPYRFGTHSGLLELCRDLGTAVIAPSCGGYADQGAAQVFASDEVNGFDPASFRRALGRAVAAGPVPALSRPFRERQRRAVADGYLRAYERALRAASAADDSSSAAVPTTVGSSHG
ncbi:MAG: glycosyltransferase family 1 protein [Actinobacteria bacterium]|nr:glycosyltransferase family 1 protein [Actinomycetota bacterium]